MAEEEEPGAEIIDDAKPKDSRDKTEPAETEEKEKAEEDARIKESERKPDSPPKSPTKRSGSPTKGGRRGTRLFIYYFILFIYHVKYI